MQTNFLAAPRATRAALPSMLDQGSGSIVNIGSVNAFFEPDEVGTLVALLSSRLTSNVTGSNFVVDGA